MRSGQWGASSASSDVRLTVVGAAAAWGRGTDAASSCYLLEEGWRAGTAQTARAAKTAQTAQTAQTALVLDLGQGSFARLAAIRPAESVTAVVISHAHPDHCVDLIPLRHALRYEAGAPAGTVALLASAALPARFDAFLGESGFLDDLRFVPLEPGELQFGNLRLAAHRVRHSDESFAFRVVEGAPQGTGVVYSGDCADARELVPILHPGDTLLAEASFGASSVPPGVPHLDAGMAATAAREGGAARLVLTHIQPGVDRAAALDRARDAFSGEVLLAESGLRLEIAETDDRPIGDSGRSSP